MQSPRTSDGFSQLIRKRQRSPCDIVPLSDPDIDGAPSQKRYLSEIMSIGITMQMSLDDRMDSDMNLETAGGHSMQALLHKQERSISGGHEIQGLADCPFTDEALMHMRWPSPPLAQQLGGHIMPNADLVPISQGAGGSHSGIRIPNDKSNRAGASPSSVNNSRSGLLSPPTEIAPASPSDAFFPSDLRKTALLRSLLLRTEDMSQGQGVAGRPIAAAIQMDTLIPDDVWTPLTALISSNPTSHEGHVNLSQDISLEGIDPCQVPGAIGSSVGAAIPRPNSRSESMLEDTLSSNDTTGSSIMDEVEGRRMTLQAGTLSTCSDFFGITQTTTVVSSFGLRRCSSGGAKIPTADTVMPTPILRGGAQPSIVSTHRFTPNLDMAQGINKVGGSESLGLLSRASSHDLVSVPLRQPNPNLRSNSPAFDQERLVQLRARAVAESAQLTCRLEDPRQFMAKAPHQLMSAHAQVLPAGLPMVGHGVPVLRKLPTIGSTNLNSKHRYRSDEGSGNPDMEECSSEGDFRAVLQRLNSS